MKALTAATVVVSSIILSPHQVLATYPRPGYSNPSLVSPKGFPEQDWEHQGCYVDVGRTISDVISTDGEMTNAKCTAYCFERGFIYAGTEYYSECYCGNILAWGAKPAKDGECDTYCVGNSTEACGGRNRLSLYKTGKIKPPSVNPGAGDWESMGCYIEGSTGRALERQIFSIPSSNMTAPQCIRACESEGYILGGVEYGGECFCGNKFNNFARPATIGGCTMTCHGNHTEYCGGPSRLNMYSNKLKYTPSPTATLPTATTPPDGGETIPAKCPNQPAKVGQQWKFYGCYTEGHGVRALQSRAYSDSEMSLSDCSRFCEGHDYFGVEYSRECYCGNSFQGGSIKTAVQECSMLCPGGLQCDYCGAANRLSVYTRKEIDVDPDSSSSSAGLSSTYTATTAASSSGISSATPSSLPSSDTLTSPISSSSTDINSTATANHTSTSEAVSASVSSLAGSTVASLTALRTYTSTYIYTGWNSSSSSSRPSSSFLGWNNTRTLPPTFSSKGSTSAPLTSSDSLPPPPSTRTYSSEIGVPSTGQTLIIDPTRRPTGHQGGSQATSSTGNETPIVDPTSRPISAPSSSPGQRGSEITSTTKSQTSIIESTRKPTLSETTLPGPNESSSHRPFTTKDQTSTDQPISNSESTQTNSPAPTSSQSSESSTVGSQTPSVGPSKATSSTTNITAGTGSGSKLSTATSTSIQIVPETATPGILPTSSLQRTFSSIIFWNSTTKTATFSRSATSLVTTFTSNLTTITTQSSLVQATTSLAYISSTANSSSSYITTVVPSTSLSVSLRPSASSENTTAFPTASSPTQVSASSINSTAPISSTSELTLSTASFTNSFTLSTSSTVSQTATLTTSTSSVSTTSIFISSASTSFALASKNSSSGSTSTPIPSPTSTPSSLTTLSSTILSATTVTSARATIVNVSSTAVTSAIPTHNPVDILPDGWALFGCWIDGLQGRILNKQLPDSNNLTLESCAHSCAKAGFSVAGTEYHTQCFCGNSIINGGERAKSHADCNTPCSGNSKQRCGGGDRMTIMSLGEPKIQMPAVAIQNVGSWKYEGCYEDNVDQTKVFYWQSFFPDVMTPEMCLNKCGDFGYMAAGLEYGQECYCGDPENIVVKKSKKRDEKECNIPCAGNASAICGGGSRLSTYFWDAKPFYSWDFPAEGSPEAGSYDFLIGGTSIPLITSQGINGKVTFLEKFGTGPANSTGAYELDLSEIDNWDKAWRTMHVKTDIFCAAGLTLPDKAGRQINVGGWSGASLYGVRLYAPDGSDGVHGKNDWEEDASVLKLQDGRWYPTAMNMANGSILIIGGEEGSNSAPVPTLEILPYTGTKPLHMDWLERTDPNNLYPFTAVLPSGGIFVAYWNEARILNEDTFETVKTLPMIPGAVNDPKGGRTYPLEGTAVLLPQHAPYTDPLGVLICGGSTDGPHNALDNCVSTYPDADEPKWELERMPSPRVMSCMAPLPDGTYLILNGAHHGVAGFGLGVGPNLNALLYDPKKPLGHRITVMANTTVARLYHSEGITLLDGRVLVTGSDPQDGVNPQEYRIETFTPPYLLSGKKRPTFTMKNTDWEYGQKISFDLGDSPVNGDITASILGSVSSTHGNSMGARTLIPEISCSGTSCTVTSPPGKYIAPPGWYQFFVLDGGIPAVGIFVRIGGDPAGLGNWPKGDSFKRPGV